jgi:hypothetical protein
MNSEDDVWEKVEREVVNLLGNGEAANALNELLSWDPGPFLTRQNRSCPRILNS